MRNLIAAAVLAATAALAFTAGHVTAAPHGTYCATEDSCGYSYAHNTGIVVRVTP